MSDKREKIARTIGFGVAAATGLGFYAVALAPSAWRLHDIFSIAFMGGGDPGEFARSGRLATAVMGAVLIGWAATAWRATRPSDERPKDRLSAALIWGATAWFIPDMIASLYFEAYGNAAMNLPFYGLLLWPAIEIRKREATAAPGSSPKFGEIRDAHATT